MAPPKDMVVMEQQWKIKDYKTQDAWPWSKQNKHGQEIRQANAMHSREKEKDMKVRECCLSENVLYILSLSNCHKHS